MKNFTLLILLVSFNLYCQDYPNSSPNGGRIGGQSWTVENYIENAQKDSLFLMRVIDNDVKMALYTKNTSLLAKMRNVKSKKKIETMKQQYDNEYRETLSVIYNKYKFKFEKINQYRDEWVNYLKAEESRKLAQEKQLQKEKELEKIKNEEEQKLREESAKLDYQKRVADYKRISTDTDYIKWKGNYENLLVSANKNVTICNAIINKHSFRNIFGEKLYDSSTFSNDEKKRFNQSLDILNSKIEQIKILEENNKFYMYWNDNASIEESVKSFNLSNFYYNTNRA